MSTSFKNLSLGFTCFTAITWAVLVFSGTGQVPAQESTKQSPGKLNLDTDPNVDEQLFMLRNLEFLHSQFPTQLEDPKQISIKLALVRKEMVRCEEYAKEKGMEPRLISMYTDSIKIAEQFGELMIDIGAIDRIANIDKDAQAAEDFMDAGKELGLGGFAMGAAAVEPITATVVLTGMAIKKAIDSNAKAQKLNEQKRHAHEKRTNQFLNDRSRLMGRIETQAGVIGEKLKWKPSEVGFDNDEEEANKINEASKKNDLAFFFKRADNLIKTRPRDPFVFIEKADLFERLASQLQFIPELTKSGANCSEEAAQSYLRAIQLIPQGVFHDSLRAKYIWKAASTASMELYHSQKKTDFPSLLADEALRLKPKDPSGAFRKLKAFALARNGETRQALDMYKKIVPVLGESWPTYYDWACLLSLSNETDEAFEKLNFAWNKEKRYVREMRIDKDLENLRNNRKDDFDTLVKVKVNNRISYGYFWNDMGFTNKSGFSLTFNAFKTTWIGKGGAKYSEVYFTDKLDNDLTWWCKGAFDNASESNAIGFFVEHACRENQSVKPLAPKDVQGNFKGIATRAKYSGEDVQETIPISISVDPNQETGLRMAIDSKKISFALKADEFNDGNAYVSSKENTIRIIFDGKIAYGWFHDSKDPYTWSFWVEK